MFPHKNITRVAALFGVAAYLDRDSSGTPAFTHKNDNNLLCWQKDKLKHQGRPKRSKSTGQRQRSYQSWKSKK